MKKTKRIKVIEADQMKGVGDSLYMNTTGRQNRYDIVSIKRIIPSILKINKGLISFIFRSKSFAGTNIVRINFVMDHLLLKWFRFHFEWYSFID
jgi:hypothetical protein